MEPLLKVYPAKYWNDQVLIFGNRQGLMDLKHVIEHALSHVGTLSVAELKETTQDDQVFSVGVKTVTEDEVESGWDKLPIHAEDVELLPEEKQFLAEFAECEDYYYL